MDEQGAPEWYINHFLSFGYTAEQLEKTWSSLSQPARASYHWALVESQER